MMPPAVGDDARMLVNNHFGMPEDYGEHPASFTVDSGHFRFSNFAYEPECHPWGHEVKNRDRSWSEEGSWGTGSGSAVADFSRRPTEWGDSSGDSIELVVVSDGAGGPRTNFVEDLPTILWPRILTHLLHHCNWG